MGVALVTSSRSVISQIRLILKSIQWFLLPSPTATGLMVGPDSNVPEDTFGVLLFGVWTIGRCRWYGIAV